MGLLDSVIGAIGGSGAPQGGGGQAALLNLVLGMLANQGGSAPSGGLGAALGGLGGLIGRFQQGGLGHVVSSWVGTGENLPVSADQLQSVLGSDMVAQIAQHLGVSHVDAAGQLSQLLPDVVDKLTPHGQLPDGDLSGIGEILGKFAGR